MPACRFIKDRPNYRAIHTDYRLSNADAAVKEEEIWESRGVTSQKKTLTRDEREGVFQPCFALGDAVHHEHLVTECITITLVHIQGAVRPSVFAVNAISSLVTPTHIPPQQITE